MINQCGGHFLTYYNLWMSHIEIWMALILMSKFMFVGFKIWIAYISNSNLIVSNSGF